MKSFLVAALFAALVVVVTSQQPKPLPLENIDVDNILKNDKLVQRHVDCVLDKGRCDTNGKDLKEMLPRVLNENCSGCTPKQVANSNRIIDFMKKERAADWAQIEPKYRRS